MPDAVDTVTWAPDDEWRYHPKQVERFTDINKLYIVASCWTIIGIYFNNIFKKLYNNIIWISFACRKRRTDKECPTYFDDCVEAVRDLRLLPWSTREQRCSVLLRSVLTDVSGQPIGPIFKSQESCWVITQRGVVILYRRFGMSYRYHLQRSRVPESSGNSLRTFGDELSFPSSKVTNARE